MEETIEMSDKELTRFNILSGVKNKTLSQIKAAQLLGITDRQVRNLLVLLERNGPRGLVSKKRGHPSNRRRSQRFKEQVLNIIREKYVDFGPTLANEKLEEKHTISLSTETLRQWMIEAKIWYPKRRKIKTHPLRKRKECFGEMIQIDGSHEFWFEDRGEKCVAIVFIDDATGKITGLHFSKGESLDAYFITLEKHLKNHGRPISVYSDRFCVFDSPVEGNLTQFQRSLKTLGIKSILANSPQAKGRVERANRTLQDRLIKEMRLQGISDIEKANEFADTFVKQYNKHFSKEPASQFDAHRPLETRVDLSRVLSRYEERTLTKDAVFQFHNKFYKIKEVPEGKRIIGKKVEVRVGKDGSIRTFLEDKEVNAVPLETVREERATLPPKPQWKERAYKAPSATHPWRGNKHNRRVA